MSFENPLDGLSWDVFKSMERKRILMLPIAALLILALALLIPLVFAVNVVHTIKQRHNLRRSIYALSNMMDAPTPHRKTLDALWEHCDLAGVTVSWHESLGLLHEWLTMLYGADTAARINVQARASEIVRRQVAANEHFDGENVGHLTFAPPIESLIRELAGELPPYEYQRHPEQPPDQSHDGAATANVYQKEVAMQDETPKSKHGTYNVQIIDLYIQSVIHMITRKFSAPPARYAVQVFILGMIDMHRQVHKLDRADFVSAYGHILSKYELSPTTDIDSFIDDVGSQAAENKTVDDILRYGARSLQRYVAEHDAEAPTDLISTVVFAERNEEKFQVLPSSK